MPSLRSILTDKLYLSAVGVVAVFLVAVAYIFTAVLDRPLDPRDVTTLEVELAQTGGLFEGSAVTYRGSKVGKITAIVPADKGVVATVNLSSGAEIPEDSLARVRSLSPVGEQYLDFQPRTIDGPFLQDGDLVRAESTDLPKSLSSTVVAVNKVLSQIDDRKLKQVLGELSAALAGTGSDLGEILDQGNLVLSTLDDVWPETDRVITNGGTVLAIGTDNADSLRSLATNARTFAAFLREYTPEFNRTMDRAPRQFEDLVRLIQDAEKVLPGFLSVGVSLTDVVMAYEPHLRALLQEYADGIGTLASVLRGGKLNIDLITVSTARCRYSNVRHEPHDPERYAFQADGRCPASFSRLQRGAAHAPGPVR